MAFDGTLSRLSAGAERPVSEGLFVLYHGVQAPDPQPLVLSPNRDGIDERQLFRYKLPRAAAVAVRLIGPDGGIRYSENSTKARGSYQQSWPGTRPTGRASPRQLALGRHGARRAGPELDGRAAVHAQHDARLPARVPRGRELGRPGRPTSR